MDKNSGNGKSANGTAIGLCLGLAIGTAIGAATNNIGLWMPVGLCLGLCFGPVLGEKDKPEEGAKEEDRDEE